MTLAELTRLLSDCGIENSDVDARLLLSHFFSVSTASLLADPQRDFASSALEEAVARRRKREPLQYILGKTDFYEERYELSPACLIPRFDTELLVQEAIDTLPQGAHFADLGTGSGCIAISVLAHRPDLSAVAVDISESALALAKQNAEKNGVSDRITFAHADILTEKNAVPKDVGVILSNPPYITRDAMASLAPELAFEPQTALFGGEDGLDFYRAILKNYPVPLYLFEIGFDQGDALRALAKEYHLFAKILRDLGGNDRLAVLSSEG